MTSIKKNSFDTLFSNPIHMLKNNVVTGVSTFFKTKIALSGSSYKKLHENAIRIINIWYFLLKEVNCL